MRGCNWKNVEESGIRDPLRSSKTVVLYEDVDTSNIEDGEDEEMNAIIYGNRKSLQSIREAIQDKEGKTVSDYTVRYGL